MIYSERVRSVRQSIYYRLLNKVDSKSLQFFFCHFIWFFVWKKTPMFNGWWNFWSMLIQWIFSVSYKLNFISVIRAMIYSRLKFNNFIWYVQTVWYSQYLYCKIPNVKNESEGNEKWIWIIVQVCVRKCKTTVIKRFFPFLLRSIHKYIFGDIFSMRCVHINPLW